MGNISKRQKLFLWEKMVLDSKTGKRLWDLHLKGTEKEPTATDFQRKSLRKKRRAVSFSLHIRFFFSWFVFVFIFRPSLVAHMVKNLPAVQKTQVWSLGWEDPLEKGMATHFSTLAWRIPWTEERGRLQSTGLQRVKQAWSNLACTHIAYKSPVL